MTERPAYRVLVPGLQHFDCDQLRACLSTKACGQRWSVAVQGSACHGCAVGRLHAGDHGERKRPGRPSAGPAGACLRCGRTDLRIIKCNGLCVSCSNRQSEWVKGKNAKGKVPVDFIPPHDVEVCMRHADGRIERLLVPALHQAEAVGRVLRDMPEGARFIAERRLTAWNASARQFEHVCTRCGTQGLILERQRHGRLERHAWCCEGDPVGAGWHLAEVRQQLFAMHPAAAAAWFETGESEETDHWQATGHPCAACGAGQIEIQLSACNGLWQTRCNGCGVGE